MAKNLVRRPLNFVYPLTIIRFFCPFFCNWYFLIWPLFVMQKSTISSSFAFQWYANYEKHGILTNISFASVNISRVLRSGKLFLLRGKFITFPRLLCIFFSRFVCYLSRLLTDRTSYVTNLYRVFSLLE